MALQQEIEKQGIWLFRYRGVLPLFILGIGAYLYMRTEIYPGTFILEGTRYETPYEMCCLALSLLGLAIRIYTVGYASKNTSGRNTKGQVADSLNTSGSYSVVRHPLYLGNFLMWLGPAMLTGNFWFIIAFCFSYWVYYERIMFAEEQYLTKKFNDTYLEWAAQVPAFFPDFRRFRKPVNSFNWRKVIRAEKNGLTFLLLIFCILNIAGELAEGDRDFNYFTIGFCILSIIAFAVIKILQKTTSVLDDKN